MAAGRVGDADAEAVEEPVGEAVAVGESVGAALGEQPVAVVATKRAVTRGKAKDFMFLD
jgi:hypothetical protein